ncbi:hypothetical protein BDQ17DRAFT_1376230 [Cyathus striatus]|nr:hypothetical protein BDQ17DRAFT_1376230 [Cyathus striatus]
MNTTQCIQPNADVSGIGIRINLYATTLLLSVIPHIPGLTTPLIEVLSANAGISGAALIITAIIQTAKGQLTLYHSIFIIHMLFFLELTMSPSGRYPGARALLPRLIITGALTYAMMLLYTGWALYVWSTADTFGVTQGCNANNEIKYIFFFRSVRATAKWIRGLWMAGLCGGALALVIVPMLFTVCLCRRRSGLMVGEEEIPRTNWSLPLAAVYDVVMLELYVKRNRHLIASSSEEQAWTFGQIITIVMILSTLNELLHFMINSYFMFSAAGRRDMESQIDEIDQVERQTEVPAQIEEGTESQRESVNGLCGWMGGWGKSDGVEKSDSEEDIERKSQSF